MPEIKTKPERGIVAAACQINGLTVSHPAPARHHDILWSIICYFNFDTPPIQGFLDHRGVFVGRKATLIVRYELGGKSRKRNLTMSLNCSVNISGNNQKFKQPNP